MTRIAIDPGRPVGQHVYFSVDATGVGGAGLGAGVGSGLGSDEVGGEGILIEGAPNGVARVDPRAGVQAGSRVTFAVNTSRLHFFDPDTGNAIG